MRILVDNKTAVLKSGTSFDYICENRLFMGRDSYTLNLTFPLKDCPDNRAIFGHIERMDVAKTNLQFDCEIRDRSFVAYGTLTITEINQSEVSAQFSEGRCQQTATDPFEETYINDLDIGVPPQILPEDITPSEAMMPLDSNHVEVALPWINASSGDFATVPNNWMKYNAETDAYEWDEDVISPLSWQPYLIEVTKRICREIGYTYDFSEWEDSDYRYLLVCNTLPPSWGSPYKDILPRWTVTEFFEQLELLMTCEFDFDHRAQHVKFSFSKTVLDAILPVKLDNIVDDYTGEVSTDEDVNCEYIGAKRLVYKDTGHSMQAYYECDFIVKEMTPITFHDIDDLIRYLGTALCGDFEGILVENESDRETKEKRQNLYYVSNIDTYFVVKKIYTYIHYEMNIPHYFFYYALVPVNQFGSGSTSDDDTVDLDIVPVCIMDTLIGKDDDRGYMMSLDFNGYDDSTSPTSSEDYAALQPKAAALIEAGETTERSEYYSVINVAFWNGEIPFWGRTPYPFVDSVNVDYCDANLAYRIPFNYNIAHIIGLRLSDSRNIYLSLPKLDPRQKFKFSWLSDEIPNPRAIFNIRGKRYICEKITATFTEEGKSQLLKGEFYPLA